MDKVTKIRVLNDLLRTTFAGGKVMMTRGIASLPEPTVAAILQKVRAFDSFNEGNDPYGEHDFGSFEHEGHTINWQIAYYDKQLEYGSDEPENPQKTSRVLTIMLAEER